MSIQIDWEVTDAPGDGEVQPSIPPSQPPGRQPPEDRGTSGGSGGQPPAGSRSGWRRWAIVTGVLAAAFGLGLWAIAATGWQRVTAEVTALVRYEEQLAYGGDTDLLLNVQDQAVEDWIAVRRAEAQSRQPAPLPAPHLQFGSQPLRVESVTAVDADWVRADVHRLFRSPHGEVLNFVLPQFYRRDGPTDWMRSIAPVVFWGGWLDWRSPHLFIRHSDRDSALVREVGPQIELLLARACRLWGSACDRVLPAKLYFSSYVGSLEYDPLANIEVRVEFEARPNGPGLPPDYFVSVPSPHLAGVPADESATRFLAEYLAVRLIASLADRAMPAHSQSQALVAQAIDALDLAHADPGFASLNDIPVTVWTAVALGSPVTGSVQPSPGPRGNPELAVVAYVVQPGDTLYQIASDFGTTVEAIASLNRITDPDLIRAGTSLLIPQPGPDDPVAACPEGGPSTGHSSTDCS